MKHLVNKPPDTGLQFTHIMWSSTKRPMEKRQWPRWGWWMGLSKQLCGSRPPSTLMSTWRRYWRIASGLQLRLLPPDFNTGFSRMVPAVMWLRRVFSSWVPSLVSDWFLVSRITIGLFSLLIFSFWSLYLGSRNYIRVYVPTLNSRRVKLIVEGFAAKMKQEDERKIAGNVKKTVELCRNQQGEHFEHLM